jgi:hypothetical protein
MSKMEKKPFTERTIITAFTAEGRKRSGIPVLGGEWLKLRDNTPVILVDSLDDLNPIEHFFVYKKKFTNRTGETLKRSAVEVFAKDPTKK